MNATYALPPEFEDCIGVFQGGGCRAAAYAGAYSAAVDRGVHFDELAGASAGSIAAVLIAAGASPEWLEERLSELDFGGLLGKPKGKRFPARGKRLPGRIYNLVRFNGMFDGSGIETWVEKQLRELLPGALKPQITFADLPRSVAVIAANLETHGPKVWSSNATPDESVARAVRSSCSIPFFFQPHGPYVDGGVVSNLPLHIVDNDPSDRRRILAFSLVESGTPKRPRDVISTAVSLSSTVTEGGKTVQQGLQKHVDVISIRCGDVSATDFESMTPEKVETLIAAGRDAVSDFFGAGPAVVAPIAPSSTSTHLAQTLAGLAERILDAQAQILIAMADTRWVFELYSALLLARIRGVRIRVVIPKVSPTAPDLQQQRDTLRALGCEVSELAAGETPSVRAFICDPGQHGATAVVYSREDLRIHARLLSSEDGDEATISLIASAIESLCATETPSESAIEIVHASEEEVAESLRAVRQYSDASFMLGEVKLEEIDAWARYAHVYKQVQQRAMLRHLRLNAFAQFEPYWVRYGSNKQSLGLPVVLEQRPDGRYIVVNGLSRLLLLAREGRETALCAVVSGVTAPAPAEGVETLSYLGVRVGIRGDATHRYPGFIYQNTRTVERRAHAIRDISGEV